MKDFETAVQDGRGLEFFEQWNNEVDACVPSEKLLKFDVAEGWEPLCEFVGAEAPDVPFPHVNSCNEFMQARALVYRRAWLLVYECVTLPVCLYGIYKFLRT